MQVIKRNGSREPVFFDKISERIARFAIKNVDPLLVAQKVIQGVHDGVKTFELDELAAETAAYMTTIHPNYETLALKLRVSNLHKETRDDFQLIYEYVSDEVICILIGEIFA